MSQVSDNFGRRAFVSTALASGFALAVRPVAASTITTDSDGLAAGEIKIGQMPAYHAMPATGSNFPVALVVHEIFGVHEHIKDVCRRFAKMGYLAVAPDLFARQGAVATLPDIGEVMKVVVKVPDAQVMGDLDSCVNWARGTGKANIAKLGITGFCWGGRIVWLYAARSTQLKAGVAWYGRISGADNANQTSYPIEVARTLKAPVLGLYGGRDEGIPQGQLDMMKREVAAANGKSQIVVYPEAHHGFFADYRPSYDQNAATDGWKRLGDWFKANGAG